MFYNIIPQNLKIEFNFSIDFSNIFNYRFSHLFYVIYITQTSQVLSTRKVL